MKDINTLKAALGGTDERLLELFILSYNTAFCPPIHDPAYAAHRSRCVGKRLLVIYGGQLTNDQNPFSNCGFDDQRNYLYSTLSEYYGNYCKICTGIGHQCANNCATNRLITRDLKGKKSYAPLWASAKNNGKKMSAAKAGLQKVISKRVAKAAFKNAAKATKLQGKRLTGHNQCLAHLI